MKKLFIIGNGFDSAHHLSTKYKHFRKYLIKEYDNPYSYIPEEAIGPDGETANYRHVAGLLINLFDDYYNDEDWGDVEAALPDLDYRQFLEDVNMQDDDRNIYHTIYSNEDTINNLGTCMPIMKELIHEWLETVVINANTKKAFPNLINEDGLFLTFNYTDTLEKVYKIDTQNICHIHGMIGQDIVFGHGKIDNLLEGAYSRYFISEVKLQDVINSMKKDVDGCLEMHKAFFVNLSKEPIQDIYSIGFSFADVDLEYIREICRRIDTSNVVWHLTHHNKKKNKIWEFEQAIRGCGFKGAFGVLI